MVLNCFVTAVNVTAVTKLISIFHLRKFKPQKTTMMLHFLEGGFSRHLISYFKLPILEEYQGWGVSYIIHYATPLPDESNLFTLNHIFQLSFQ